VLKAGLTMDKNAKLQLNLISNNYFKKQSLLTRSAQNQQKSWHNPERLIATHSIKSLKYRQQTIMSRAVPQNNDGLDIIHYWWLTPSIHRLALNPSNNAARRFTINPLL
jgi:hypothetical protein